jgi:aspartyl protease family protein
MSLKPFFYVIGAGAAIGFLMPMGQSPAPQQASLIEPTKPARKIVAVPAAPLDIVLTRNANGHFFADVEVNGQTIRFLVDTGATAIALTADDARKLGFSWNDQELEPVGRGVSGPVTGKMVELHHVRLGGKEGWDMRAAIIPQGLEVSLLGQTFLGKIGSVRISGDQMVLR